MTKLRLAAAVLALSLITAAAARAESPFATNREPAQPTRHTRDFASSDIHRALRLAIATLQNLGFALENADNETGTLIASRLDTHPLRLTVTISAKSETEITAAVSSAYAATELADPTPANTFFAAYEAALSPPPEID
jgi:hypothetical protein